MMLKEMRINKIIKLLANVTILVLFMIAFQD